MKAEKYPLKANTDLAVFEFTSEGPKGKIQKLVKINETNLKDLYTLGFGDKDQITGDINDLSISNNGNSEKVLATVVNCAYAFTDKHPDSFIYATGSTKARTRLYRMGLTKHLKEVLKDFDLYGLLNDDWEKFEKEIEYDAFLVQRKKS